jgi:Cu(I)/Ag(I) efflux system membrane fusion protein
MKRGAGKYQSVRVEVGRESQGQVEILDGLMSGDTIVTSAQFMLDSESSLSADFSRIGPPDRHTESVVASGVVIAVKDGALTIAHEPVPEWEWPGMVMDFPLKQTEITEQIVPGRELKFTINKQDNQFPISKLVPGDLNPDALKQSAMGHDHSSMDHSSMDHSQMDHGSVDHSTMDHSQMEHGSMDHSTMDHSQMDHGNMEHSTMDHSQMDHSDMDHSQMGHRPQQNADIDTSTLVDEDLDWLDLDDEEGEQ